MHLVIPFAAPLGNQCRLAVAQLQLPHLRQLLMALPLASQMRGQPSDLSPLSERIASGDRFADGLIPWAALKTGQTDSAWITPCHLKVQADHVAMTDPSALALEDTESKALMQAMAPYFLEDGLTLQWQDAGTWLAHGPLLRSFQSASLERVRGQPVDPWIPRQDQAKTIRRLQNEMQMLLYTHPINDARTARGALPVSSFWLSGTGNVADGASNVTSLPETNVLKHLQASALQDDAYAWMAAWHAMDQGPLKTLLSFGQQAQLSLCGETQAQTFGYQPQNLWQRLRKQIQPPSVASILLSL
jgi:hypothetical protein